MNKNEDQLEILNNHDLENEYRILQQLIDYHQDSEKRLHEPNDPKKNRYCDISPCKKIYLKKKFSIFKFNFNLKII